MPSTTTTIPFAPHLTSHTPLSTTPAHPIPPPHPHHPQGPMPIMIWIAALVEVIKASLTGDGWLDFGVLMVLQFANAMVGYTEERNAGDAISALKNALKPMAHVCRDSVWSNMAARELVPGDLIEVKLGDVVPADAILLPGMTIQADQSALTGESLPTTVHPGMKLMMGSAIKRGESKAIVVQTGANTFLGKAAGLLAGVEHTGRFQKILNQITLSLLIICLIFAAIIFGKLQTAHNELVRNLSIVVVILVASIPIAIEVVCTSTLAVGSRRLAEKKIIVARLSAIEELAGMTILCSDKTGTLTLNKLSLREPIPMLSMDANEIHFYAALASKREEGNQDAIDFCITKAVRDTLGGEEKMKKFVELEFEPFNPTDKRAEATIRAADNSVFRVTKGAPQAVLRMCHNAAEIRDKVDQAVQDLADRGFRALGLAITYTGVGETPQWEFEGILSLYDPPRPDTKATIAQARENGIEVKMVTGDHTVIAKETCRELGMGANILNTDILNDPSIPAAQLDEIILSSHGFAEVMPEHKFQIVERIRAQGHVCGMTGDGVNDAPALKRADIGIAVFPCTDAAKAASDIVLTEPGLSVIIDAIFRSRKIFQRMRNYCIYRISCTLQLLFFFFFAIMSIDPTSSSFCQPQNGMQPNSDTCIDVEFPQSYNKTTNWCTNGISNSGGACGMNLANDYSFTLPVISLVIITILNDGCMITIAHDKVVPEKRPQSWAMFEVTCISIMLAAVACLSSMILLILILHSNYNAYVGRGSQPDFIGRAFGENGQGYVTWMEARTIMYLKISISDFLTLFSARTRVWFWERRPGYALGVACLVATGSSTLLSLFWDKVLGEKDSYMKGLAGGYGCLSCWIYCILWFFVQDVCKVLTYKLLEQLSKEKMDRLLQSALRGAVSLPSTPLLFPL
jgi:H+-transporting ATPase